MCMLLSFLHLLIDRLLNYCYLFNCRRQDKKADRESRLCSCHFKDGDKRNGPSIFDYGQNAHKRRFTFNSPEKRSRKRYTLCTYTVVHIT